MFPIRTLGFLGFILFEVTFSIAGAQDGCEGKSQMAIVSGMTAEKFCHGQINPEERPQNLSVLEDCLKKMSGCTFIG